MGARGDDLVAGRVKFEFRVGILGLTMWAVGFDMELRSRVVDRPSVAKEISRWIGIREGFRLLAL